MNMAESVVVPAARLKRKILQSPMAGCTDLVYRRIAREFGCTLAFTEMVKDRPVIEGIPKTFSMLRTADWDHPLGMQLLGREPSLMAEAARRLEGLGADLIDVNLGCPVSKVTDDGCGAALLQDPSRVGRILEAMIGAVRVPVTIKMRTGFGDGDDGRFLEIARIAGGLGVGSITVHGRTRKQMYAGYSNLEAIRAVKEVASVPVIGNGDIRRGEDARRMVEATGCDGVMLARGALGNPWLYREVEAALDGMPPPPPPGVADKAAVLRRHFALLRDLDGDAAACRGIRRVVHWYVKGASGSASLRDRGNRIETPAQFEALTAEFEGSTLEDSARDAKLRA
jgi:tRNA-dihydrouridine synthase B